MTPKTSFCITKQILNGEEQAKVDRTENLVDNNKKTRNDSQVLRYSKHTKITPICMLHIPQVMSCRSIVLLELDLEPNIETTLLFQLNQATKLFKIGLGSLK
jgi:hypothetical protein